MPSFISIAQTVFLVEDEQTSVNIEFVRSGDVSQEVSINYITNDFTALANVDYIPVDDGTVVFAPGEVTATETLQILPDGPGGDLKSFSVTILPADGGGDVSLEAPRTTQVVLNADELIDNDIPLDNLDVQLVPVATGINRAIDIAFLPTDPEVMLVAQQPGLVSVVVNGVVSDQPLLDIQDVTNFIQDRGLISIALHPDFENNPYLYAAVVVDPPDVDTAGLTASVFDDPDGGGSRYMQLLQFELATDPQTGRLAVVPGSEIGGARQVLLGKNGQSLDDVAFRGQVSYDTSPDFADTSLYPASGLHSADATPENFIRLDSRSHGVGDIVFDNTGALVLTIGDGSVFNYADPRAVGVQNLERLEGKVVRIDPLTGLGLPDNPFVDQANGNLDLNVAKISQYGLRNGFRTAIRDDGEIFIGDVGWFSFEEINNGAPGANFGWPYYEGGFSGENTPTPGYRNFAEAQAFYAEVAAGREQVTAPVIAFSHRFDDPGFQANALMAGDFFAPDGPYPDLLDGTLLFSDIVSGRIFALDTRQASASPLLLSETPEFVVDWTTGPDGRIWYASLFNGEVGYLTITETGTGDDDSLISFNNFSAGSLTINGSTLITSGVLQLTPATFNQAGSAWFSDAVPIGADTSIETSFTFRTSGGQGSGGADGLAFVLHNDPRATAALGQSGGDMAYGGAGRIENSVAILFDTYRNPFDPGADQVAIVRDGDVTVPLARIDAGLDLNAGALRYVWIDYDGTTDLLEVYLDDTATKPATPLLTTTIDLFALLGGGALADQFYSGFTAGTGGLTNSHSVLNWQLDLVDQVEVGITALDASLPEGGPDAFTTFRFEVTRSGALDRTDDIAWAVTGIGANPASGSDFRDGSLPVGMVRFAPGETSKTITVLVAGDAVDEPDEEFVVALAPAQGVSLVRPTATGVIVNDDAPSDTRPRIEFTDFASPTGLEINGSADFTDSLLRLTPSSPTLLAGSAWLAQPLAVDADTSFTSTFAFQLSGGLGSGGADGFTFVLQNDQRATTALGAFGGDFGFGGPGSIGSSLAIAFDTYANFYDPAADQVAVLRDGNVRNPVARGDAGFDLNSGATLYARIDYDGTTDLLEIYLDDAPLAAAATPVLTATLALDGIVGARAFAGFTGGTGAFTNDQDILNWTFASEGLQLARTLTITPSTLAAPEGGAGEVTTFSFVIDRSGDLSVATTFDWAVLPIASGGADPVSPSDFVGGTLPGGTLTLAAGEASRVITVEIAGDTSVEADEAFRFELSDVSNATVVTPSVEVVVENDDTGPMPDGVTVTFTDFAAATGITLNGSAGLVNDRLQLTPGARSAAGSAWLEQELGLGTDGSFTTAFVFDIDNPSTSGGADGFAFVLQNSDEATAALGALGGDLGYARGTGMERSLAVLFDTYRNPFDPGANQIAVVRDGTVTSSLARADAGVPLDSGSLVYAWIDYDGVTDLLEVYLASDALRPAAPVLTTTVDLAAVVGTTFYAGFSAGTGALFNSHEIVSWSLSTEGAAALSELDIGAASSVSQPEGAGGEVTEFVFTVTRTGDLSRTAVIDWAVEANGLGLDGADFVGGALPTGTLTLPSNQSSGTITVQVAGDAVVEADERFRVTLSNPQEAFIRNGTIGATIVDDDGAVMRIEAEDFTGLEASSYSAESAAAASEGGVIALPFGGAGSVTTSLAGFGISPGSYTVKITYVDELDGSSNGTVRVDDMVVGAPFSFTDGSFVNPGAPRGNGLEAGNFKTLTLAEPVTLTVSSELTIDADTNATARARIDYIELFPVSASPALIEITSFAAEADRLTLNGAAQIVGERVQLTPASLYVAGSAWFEERLAVDADTSLQTEFTFQLSGGNGSGGADGFTFTLQNAGLDAIGRPGGNLGAANDVVVSALGPGTEVVPASLSVGFDTFANGGDVSSNRLVIFRDGDLSDALAEIDLGSSFDLNGGGIGRARIIYDGTTNLLEVFVAAGAAAFGGTADLSAQVDLAAIVGEAAHAGFTAATGGLTNAHEIVDWTLDTDDGFFIA